MHLCKPGPIDKSARQVKRWPVVRKNRMKSNCTEKKHKLFRLMLVGAVTAIVTHKVCLIAIPSIFHQYMPPSTFSEAVISAIVDPFTIFISCVIVLPTLGLVYLLFKRCNVPIAMMIGIVSGYIGVNIYPGS